VSLAGDGGLTESRVGACGGGNVPVGEASGEHAEAGFILSPSIWFGEGGGVSVKTVTWVLPLSNWVKGTFPFD